MEPDDGSSGIAPLAATVKIERGRFQQGPGFSFSFLYPCRKREEEEERNNHKKTEQQKRRFNKSSIINLSQSLELTSAQSTLLDKGLSFIPSHLMRKTEKGLLLAELGDFHDRIQRAVFFGLREETGRQIRPFCEKSGWMPQPQQLPGEVWDFFDKNVAAVQLTLSRAQTPRRNLTQGEVEALEELVSRRDIVIKPADKGSAVVIMDRTGYVQEGKRQLTDESFYSKLEAPIFLESVPRIEGIVNTLEKTGFIGKRQKNYLLGEKAPRPRRFYLLPKVHKPREKWPNPFMPPGRPIVSDCGSESYRVAEFIDFYLNPLSTRHASYIRDTYDFLEKVKDLRVPPGVILFSLDVESLYTNIETPLGLKAVRDCFDRYPDSSRPEKEILELLELSLTCNDFEFEGEWYLQIKGTAMGKKFAPAYANIYMAQWEETVFPKCEKRPLAYFRFLDDVWGLWSHGQQDFDRFLGILNTHHDSIRVQAVVKEEAIEFLDTTVYKGPDFMSTGRLDFKMFFKETDTHALLHHQSYHPRHTFRGIVLSQLLRFKRICSREEDFQDAKRTLFRALRARGYSRTRLRGIYKEHCRMQVNPGTAPSREDKILVPTIFSYTPEAVRLNRGIRDNFRETLADIPEGRDIALLAAYKRNRNLRDLLVHSRLPRQKGSKPPAINRSRTIKARGQSRAFVLPKIPLRTRNCIYAIQCSRCGKHYVGQTKNSIKTRLYQHRYVIKKGERNNSRRVLIEHFKQHGLHKLRIRGLEHDPGWTLRQRLCKEYIWIEKLKAWFPNGLNERREISIT